MTSGENECINRSTEAHYEGKEKLDHFPPLINMPPLPPTISHLHKYTISLSLASPPPASTRLCFFRELLPKGKCSAPPEYFACCNL